MQEIKFDEDRTTACGSVRSFGASLLAMHLLGPETDERFIPKTLFILVELRGFGTSGPCLPKQCSTAKNFFSLAHWVCGKFRALGRARASGVPRK
jgi:hypothetical protein